MPLQARMPTLQHPPDPLPIALVEFLLRDSQVRLAAEAGIHPASEVPLEFLDFGSERTKQLTATAIE